MPDTRPKIATVEKLPEGCSPVPPGRGALDTAHLLSPGPKPAGSRCHNSVYRIVRRLLPFPRRRQTLDDPEALRLSATLKPASAAPPPPSSPTPLPRARMRWCCGGGGNNAAASSASTSAHLQQQSLVRDMGSTTVSPQSTRQLEARNRVHAASRRPESGDVLEDEDANVTGPLLSPNHKNTGVAQFDRFGPMLLHIHKLAFYVNNGQHNNLLDCCFVQKLRHSGWQIVTTGSQTALADLRKHKPSVVLFDHKLHDVLEVHATLRTSPEGEDLLYAILTDRLPSEKRLKSLAKTELSQFFLTSSPDIRLCELFGRFSSRFRAIPALFAVVEEAEQPIKICDDQNLVQYVNRAYELISGQSRNDVLGTDATEMRLKTINGAPPDSSSLPPPAPPTSGSTATTPGQTQTVPENENLVPSTGSFGSVGAPNAPQPCVHTQLNTRRRSSEWHCITVPTSSQGNQYVYVKRGSADAICRDLSLKSLRSNSAMIDAPITEALNVLSTVLPKCDEDTQSHLKEAIKMLSVQELYAPNMTRFTNNDRFASGYYDGLIRLHHPARQRKRSVVDAFRENQRRVSGSETRRRISSDVVNALEAENVWQFDVIELERVTDHHPLSHLGMKIFDRWNVAETLRCNPDTIQRWLTLIEANYQSVNHYHNATHAADVLQATSYFLNSENVGQHVQDNHAIAALIAATVHDLDHPGRGNAFLMNTRQRLALLYNDHSVLENHHVALAFHLTLSQSGANIFARMSRCEFTSLRQAIIEMVLATDMTKHFEYLTKFQQMLLNPSDDEEEREPNSLTVCRMLIKCADIGNPAREWKLCHEWAMRIVEEYFEQTSEEVEKGLPVTMKGFDRESCNIPMTQCTFVDLFARETFTIWSEFADLPILLIHLESNYERWKQQSDSWEPNQNKNLRSLRS
ncbi:unnamed protein product [Bursaphelenchus okinawaensis]|uniref:Phosphodiesterase n=1 Tax=Bursaphelenchus okinawaensis TaxID=465554 RepID=A0A811JU67_9BILA|nr:unnamed protein product [Bursaphelenchus okinawaensis]CAG9083385.1 unnamed protein product [Bursaphelenchus okinawaensis]